MKRIIIALVAAIVMLGTANSLCAQTKVEKRYAYALRKLKLDKATEAKFGPVLKAYLTEKKAAGDIYDDVKDKYKAAEKAGTITDAQATQLLEAKLQSEAKELEVRKKYTEEFKKYLKPKRVYYALDYANEKMSVIEGKE